MWPSHADAKLKYKIKISDQTRSRTYLASLVEEGHSKGHGVERYEARKLHVLPAVQNVQRRGSFLSSAMPQGFTRDQSINDEAHVLTFISPLRKGPAAH